MAYFDVTYHLDADEASVESLAEAVLLEQTIETPRAVGKRYPFVRDEFMGRLTPPTPDPNGGYRVTLSLPLHTASADPAQWLNVVLGNSALHPRVRLIDVAWSPAFASLFSGPRFGLEGLRERLDVTDRPLTAGALKPVGLSPDEVAGVCRALAEGGVDVIKDDHYLADHPFCPFEERVTACLKVLAEVEARTGHRALYVPNLSGSPTQVLTQYAFARSAGVEAVMVAPFLLGLPFFHEFTSRHAEVPVLAHPSFAPAAQIDPVFLFGKLLRLYGADAVIFVNYGGRFPYSRATCQAIARALRAPWAPLKPAFPVPAGGMQVERVEELIDTFGKDTLLLIGGSLLEAGAALRERAQAFTTRVRRAAAARAA